MRRLLLSFVALLLLVGTVTVPAGADNARDRHPRPGQHAQRREYRERYRRDYRPSWSYRHYRHYGYERHLCRYQTGFWDQDRFGWYFVPTGSYIGRCR